MGASKPDKEIKKHRFMIRLNDEDFELFIKAAKNEKICRAELLRRIIHKYVKEKERLNNIK